MERQRRSFNRTVRGAKVKIELAGEHRERAETLSCYSGDTPHEERETETCETEVRSDGINMEEQEGEAKKDSGVAVREKNGKEDYLCASEKKQQTLPFKKTQSGGRQDGKDRRRVGVYISNVSFNLSG